MVARWENNAFKFLYKNIRIKKNRMHFNEFINFHNYRHKEKMIIQLQTL